jgi:FAD:protein FMN transferase
MIQEVRILMGMPITVAIVDIPPRGLLDRVFAYFAEVDRRFSPFKPDSEVSTLDGARLGPDALSPEMREILALADCTRQETDGYFDIRRPGGRIDPSGIVKGWAVRNAARQIAAAGVENFFVDAGGDIQCRGRDPDGQEWKTGIRNPFNETEIIKVVTPRGHGIATSGTYVRGQHIYDPHRPGRAIEDIVSLTVVGPDVLDADRFATAAFAMGRYGIYFIEAHPCLEGYVVDRNSVATQTSGFRRFVAS